MEDLLQDIFNSPSIQQVPGFEAFVAGLGLIFWLFLLLDILLVFAFILALRRAWTFRPELELRQPLGVKTERGYTLRMGVNQERWKAVAKKAQGETPDSLRIAVIDADGLVNDVLRQMGLEGQHMADRLSQLDPEDISSLQRVWRAHRIRNDLVHTPGYYLSDEQARRALEDFESFLREVKAI